MPRNGVFSYKFAMIVSFIIIFSVTSFLVFSDDKRTLMPENCTSDISESPPEVEYFNPNTTRMLQSAKPDMPIYKLETNRFGFRENEIKKSNPDNVTRIVVIGDSFTMGSGLNESQRFTEKTEKILNNYYQNKNIEIINAGHHSWGMKDYYSSLYHDVAELNPDMVVIAFYGLDSIGNNQSTRWRKQVMEEYNVSHEELATQKETQSAYRRTQIDYLTNLSWKTSPIRRYGNLIAQFSDQKDIKPVFFLIRSKVDIVPLKSSYNSTHTNLDVWASECNRKIIKAPDKLVKSKYNYPDSHYNIEGNKVLAERLAKGLQPILDT